MNIHNFTSNINKKILDRGHDYYINEMIIEVFETEENAYTFHIEGRSDDYEVQVELGDNGDILFSECDCPYDFGPICKHEVAAYYLLKYDLNDIKTQPLKQTTIQEVLGNLSKEELIDIIVNIADQDVTLQTSLIFKYSNGSKQVELDACQDLIDSIVRKYTGREGFIQYRDTGAFVSELGDVAEKARNTDNVLLALDIALLLLHEAIDAFQYVDDSDGDIGYLVTETLELIGEIATSHDQLDQHRIEIFEKLVAYTEQEVFEGWFEFKIDLLNICLAFTNDQPLREKLRKKIESMLVPSSNSYTDYNNESLLQLLFQLIAQHGTQEELKQFIHEHLQFSFFREQLLNQHLHEKNYQKVIEVAKEGEALDQNYPGLLSKWKKYRYEAYKSLFLIEEQRKLAKELLLAGDFQFYQELKELAGENQEEFYKNLKRELKTDNHWRNSRIFLQLIEYENDLEEILEFVREHPSYIEEYKEKLIQRYKKEVIDIYKEYIHSVARRSSNRSAYQKVCYKIVKYKEIAGKPKQVELINELMKLYRKRPAFIDELGKIK